MNSIETLKNALHLRMHGNPDDYYEESVWQTEVDAICSDMAAAINFILTESSDEEFVWLSEVFDDVMDKARSIEFYRCLCQRSQSITDDETRAEMVENIKTAAEYIGNLS